MVEQFPPYENMFIKTNNDQISQRNLASYTFTSLEKYFTSNSLDDDGITLFKKSSNEATKKFSFLERIML